MSKPPPLAIKGVDCLPPYCNLARALARRPYGLHRPPPPSRHTVGGVAVVAALVGVGVYLKMKPRGRRGRAQTSQAEGGVIGVTLSAPAQSTNENKI